jgi:hypothetical protein
MNNGFSLKNSSERVIFEPNSKSVIEAIQGVLK